MIYRFAFMIIIFLAEHMKQQTQNKVNYRMIHLRRPPVVLFGQCWRGGGQYLERAAHPVGLQGSAKQRELTQILIHMLVLRLG